VFGGDFQVFGDSVYEFGGSFKLKDRLDLARAEPTLGTTQIHSPLDFPFNCSEIKKGIKRLKNGKKEGTDLILNEFIKTGNSTLI
jgi:hypothetical protein